MRYNLTKLLLEDAEDELHVFDFDDTLGITNASTLVAGVEYLGGDPEDPKNYRAIVDMSSRLQSTTGKLQTPQDINIENPNISGGVVTGETEVLDGAQVVVVDTAQYRDWKGQYIRGGDHAKVVIGGNVGRKIIDAAKKMGKPGEIHVTDFSPSFELGAADPIDSTLGLLGDKATQGAKTAVVTARKGETEFDTFGGGKKKAQNISDIERFVQDQVGIKPDEIYGAADISNSTADNKRKLIKWLAISNDSEEIHFYDDDPENANAVAGLCDDEELAGMEINIYNAKFKDEGIPDPMQCMPQVESRWLQLAGLNISTKLLNG